MVDDDVCYFPPAGDGSIAQSYIENQRPSDRPHGTDIRLHSELGGFTRSFSTPYRRYVLCILIPHSGAPANNLARELVLPEKWRRLEIALSKVSRKAKTPLGLSSLTRRNFSFWPVTMSPCRIFSRWVRSGSTSSDTAGFGGYNGGVSC